MQVQQELALSEKRENIEDEQVSEPQKKAWGISVFRGCRLSSVSALTS